MRFHVMVKKRKTSQTIGTPLSERERAGKLVQARISDEAHKQLVALARRDTRTMSNYLERLVYQHLGITE